MYWKNFKNLFSDKIKKDLFDENNKDYKFEKIKNEKENAIRNYPDRKILDFGIGEPDDMAFQDIREVLKVEVDKIENRGYADNGIDEFKFYVAEYMKKIFSVNLNPNTEINHTIGMKSGLAYFPKILINEGDYALIPNPSYPVIAKQVEWLGGKVYFLDLKKNNGYLPKFDKIPNNILEKTKLIYINYPHNPTGAVAPNSFYEELIHFCMENKIVVVHDSAYNMLSYTRNYQSFLQFRYAKDIGVEFHSLSKSYNMTGWRLGFIAGNEILVKAFSIIKSYMDSGQFIPIQKAGIFALNHPELIDELLEKYSRRLKKMTNILRNKNFEITLPKSGIFIYVDSPKKINNYFFNTAQEVSEFLIKEKQIVTVPWDESTPSLRFSVTFEAKNIEEENEIFKDFEKRLENLKFFF